MTRKLTYHFIICSLLLCATSLSMAATQQNSAKNTSTPAKVTKQKTPTPAKVTKQRSSAPAAHSSSTTRSEHLWNLRNADIRSVIDEISRETGKNFLVDPRVNGKITIISSTPISSKDIYPVFLSILRSLGYATVEGNKVVKIVPNNEAKQMNLPIASKANPGIGDQMVVRIMPIANTSATQLVPILRPMMAPSSSIAAIQEGNILILTGHAANLKRLINIVQAVDKSNTSGIEIIQLHNAVADELVRELSELKSNNKALQVTMAANESTNSILLSGSKEGRLRIRALIAALDVPSSNSSGNARVIYLRYLNAKKFAPTLTKMFNGDGKEKSSSKQKVIIVAEPSTNSLLVSASPGKMQSIRAIIRQLDVRPAEVLIEAAIVEVNEDTLNQLGIQWGTTGSSDSSTGDSSGFGSQSGAGIGVIKGSRFGNNWAAVLSALETNSANDILSTPNVTVLNNEEAKIEVGQQISIQTGSYSGDTSDNSDQPFNTTERQNVTLHLNVTPQINEGNSIQLKIDQGNQTLENPTSDSVNPNINVESLKTTVMVDTGDIIVLGGLIQNSMKDTTISIPLLSDIPILGYLFKYTSSELVKRNLMIFIRPVIVRKAGGALDATSQKYNFIRHVQAQWANGNRFKNNHNDRLLPAWSHHPNIPQPFTGPMPARTH